MSDQYEPNSMNAVLARVETKLDNALARSDEHEKQINRLWAALSRLDVRVAMIAGGISVVAGLLKIIFFK